MRMSTENSSAVPMLTLHNHWFFTADLRIMLIDRSSLQMALDMLGVQDMQLGSKVPGQCACRAADAHMTASSRLAC